MTTLKAKNLEFMDFIERHIAMTTLKSNDPIRQVSAGLVVKNNIYIGTNQIPDITEDNPIWGNREAIRILATHAEVNAVRAALADGVNDFSQAVLYVTLHPCKNCLSMIQALGISHVFYNEEYIPSGSTVNVNTNPVTLSRL